MKTRRTEHVGQMSPGTALLTADVTLGTFPHLEPEEAWRPAAEYRLFTARQERLHTSNLTSGI